MVQSARTTKSRIITRASEEEREGSATHPKSLRRPGKGALGVTFIALTTATSIKIQLAKEKA